MRGYNPNTATDEAIISLSGRIGTCEPFLYKFVQSDTAVKSAKGYVHSISFSQGDAAPTAGTITIYDNTSGSGTVIYAETFTTTTFRGYSIILDAVFNTGLYVKFTTIADINVTVSYL